ncbi:MAG: tRNA preQ1(34) S-adenosylmethionine ribosyltransferase-isomerase QueA [Candidatus Zixiibacteriota bacterium]
MKTQRLDYHLPREQIAYHPTSVRRHCRLLRLDRGSGEISHHRFDELPHLLNAGDLLVVNDTAVIPARLLGRRDPGGGAAEVLLLEEVGVRRWRAMVRPGARLREGATIIFPNNGHADFSARVETVSADGTRIVEFRGTGRFGDWLRRVGRVPLPPYIARDVESSDRRDYQTVFARHAGAVAAPTAGLHFDRILMDRLRRRRIGMAPLTLHVGAGTFRPITTDRVEDHHLEDERYAIGVATQRRIALRRQSGRGRIIAVGTTVARALEAVAAQGVWSGMASSPSDGVFAAVAGRTDLFILPGFRCQVVDALITNFHLPRSSLLALVAAFAGQTGNDGVGMIMNAYDVAVRDGYRFYSYGDAMLIK